MVSSCATPCSEYTGRSVLIDGGHAVWHRRLLLASDECRVLEECSRKAATDLIAKSKGLCPGYQQSSGSGISSAC